MYGGHKMESKDHSPIMSETKRQMEHNLLAKEVKREGKCL